MRLHMCFWADPMSVEMELMPITGPCTIDFYLQAMQQNLQASVSHYHHTRQINATYPLSPKNMLETFQSYGRCSIISVEKECCTGILLW